MSIDSAADRPPMSGNANPTVGRRKPRMNRRALVGALLITLAVSGVMSIVMADDAQPTTRYLMAARDIDAGTTIASAEDVAAAFREVPLTLPPAVAANAVLSDTAEQLAGHVITAPLSAGRLVHPSDVAPRDTIEDAHVVLLPLASRDALGGNVAAGARIDILATYRDAGSSFTDYLARDVPVVAVEQATSAGLGTSELLVRIALDSVTDVQAIGHAVRTADVFVARTIGESDSVLPPRYRTPTDTEDLPDLTAPDVASAAAANEGHS